MTAKELARRIGVKESTIKTNFPRTQQNFLKRGIRIWKEGYGKNAEYYIKRMFEDEVYD